MSTRGAEMEKPVRALIATLGSRPRAPVGRSQLARQAAHYTSVAFVGSHLLRLLQLPWQTGCRAEVVQNNGTGRLTLRYHIAPSHVLIAKLYTDHLGAHCYDVMRTLWQSGFDRDSPLQVPEPLAFLPEHNLLIMRAVPGRPLLESLLGDSATLVSHCRRAAQWLVALHRVAAYLGTPEPDWESLKLFRICNRLVKASAARPQHSDLLGELVQLLRERLRDLPERRPVVPTHGRYHHDHVFLTADTVAVIDLDRCRPSDPGKDVAEFVRVLRLNAFRHGLPAEQIEGATDAFLREYLACIPEAAPSIGCYWSAFVLLSLLGHLKKPEAEPNVIEYCAREMTRALEWRP